MNNLLLLFLSLSLSGSVLTLVLFALRPLVGRQLSKTWQYYIWLLVLLRFLLPFPPQFSAVGELTRSIRDAVAVQSADALPTAGSGTGNAAVSGNEQSTTGPLEPAAEIVDLQQAQVDTTAGGQTPILANIWVAWLSVALVLLAYKTATYRSFARFARAGAVAVSQGRLYDLYLDELAIGNVRQTLPLYVNDLISSPMLVGVCRPAIILPPLDVSDDELRHILRHEITHHKRLDGLYKWLAQLVLCLHWFNPLVHLVVQELGKACELACDETVLKQLDARSRIGYGDALIASLKVQGNYSSSVISITMSEDAGSIKERLDAIADYQEKGAWARVISVALTGLLLCGFVFTGAYRAAEQAVSYTDIPANTGAAWEHMLEDSTGRIPRGTSRTPEDLEIVTARASGLVVPDTDVEIVVADNAAVNLVPTAADNISVDYGDALYAVSMEQKNGGWRIRIVYTGSYSIYPAATLYLPDVAYGKVDVYAEQATVYFGGVFRQGGTVNAHLENCSVFYTIPAGFSGTVNAVAPSSYFQLHSEDGYQNCDIIIANCDTFGSIADGFSKQGDSLVYSHGTGVGVVHVSMQDGGYATIESGLDRWSVGTNDTRDFSAGILTLVEQEYTVAELRERNIQGVKIAAASENVSVSTGGQTLKLQYYQESDGDYTLETVPDRGGTIEEIYLLRNASTLDDTTRTIHITIPESFNCDVLHLTTASGGITLDGCRANTVMLQTQGGNIGVNGSVVEGYFSAASANGGIDITGVSFPPGEFANNLQTDSGTVRLELPLPSSEYAFKIDAGSDARVQIDGELYRGGSAYTVGSSSAGTIKFTSASGLLFAEYK